MAKDDGDDDRVTPGEMRATHRADGLPLSFWEPQAFPNEITDPHLRTAFRTLNEWAGALKEWEIKLQAMCLIMEARFDLQKDELDAVVREVKAKNHSKRAARRALQQMGSTAANVGGATDVVGHPPDVPYSPPGP